MAENENNNGQWKLISDQVVDNHRVINQAFNQGNHNVVLQTIVRHIRTGKIQVETKVLENSRVYHNEHDDFYFIN